mgnify:CR=1 FL=1
MNHLFLIERFVEKNLIAGSIGLYLLILIHIPLFFIYSIYGSENMVATQKGIWISD